MYAGCVYILVFAFSLSGCSTQEELLKGSARDAMLALTGVYVGSYFELIGNDNKLTVRLDFLSPGEADLHVFGNISWFFTDKPLEWSCAQVQYKTDDTSLIFGSSPDCVAAMLAAFNVQLPPWRQIAPEHLRLQYDIQSASIAIDSFHAPLLLTPSSPGIPSFSAGAAKDVPIVFESTHARLEFTGLQTVDFVASDDLSPFPNCNSLAYWFGRPGDSESYQIWIGLPSDPSKCLSSFLAR